MAAKDDTSPAGADALQAGFSALIEAMRRSEAAIRACPRADQADLADGYQNLAATVMHSIGRVFTGFDPERPRFVLHANDFTRGAFSNPDSHIYCAEIVGGAEYRITGNGRGCADFLFELVSGIAGYDPAPLESYEFLDASQIEMAPDGHFEIAIGGARRPGNWLPNSAKNKTLMVRLNLGDWSLGAPSPMTIERVDNRDQEGSFQRPSIQDVADLLRETATRIENRVVASEVFSARWSESLPVNRLPAPAQKGETGYRPMQFNTQCRFQLEPDQALIVEVDNIKTSYSSVCLGNLCWLESFNIREAQSSLTRQQAFLSSDGKYRYVVSLRDPGIANWLDPAGHGTGVVFLRWQGVQGLQPGEPRVSLVPLDTVRDHFPDDEPVIDGAERAERRRQRRLQVDRRFA